MDLNDIIRSQGGIDAIASQLGIPRQQAEQGAEALLPSILEGFGNRVGEEGESGVGGIGAILDALGGAGLARNVIGPEPTEVSKGNDILGQIFGSKEVSREVAGQASQASGLDPAILKKMLPILAMLVAGYLSSQSGRQGGLGGVLGQVLGGMAGGGGGMGGLGGVLGSILGGRR
jgi:hypothetical protein